MSSFRILAHGVPIGPDGLSAAQRTLLTSEKPVRVCGAPTGAGKTYTFLRAAKEGKFVIFVVPTQALARDVESAAERMSVPHFRWDAIQSRTLRAEGVPVWDERFGEVNHLANGGGVLITTPESLAMVLHGKPAYLRVPFTAEHLAQAGHIVFDEAHTLSERGFGFLSFWMTLAAYRAIIHRSATPKVTLLSATPTALWKAWLRLLDPSVRDYVQLVDEELVGVPSKDVRWLHGDVTVTIEERAVFELLESHASEMKGGRILVVYDSIAELSKDLSKMDRVLSKLGLSREEVYVVDGQDKQVERTLDTLRFPSGLEPASEHRLIIGTSAIEMGVNYPEIRCAVLAPGPDAAALLQRIGRVARGRVDGRIWISSLTGHHFYSAGHVERMAAHLHGDQEISHVRTLLMPWRKVDFDQAYALGGAYWSFLENRAPGHLREFLGPAFEALSADGTKRPSALLNAIRVKIAEANDRSRYGPTLSRWLAAIDAELESLRDFSPTVRIQFGDNPVIEYSREWIETWLDLSHVDIRSDGVWHFPKPRNDLLLDKPRVYERHAIHPFEGRVRVFTGANHGSPVVQFLKRNPTLTRKEDKDLWNLITEFTRRTGLLAYDSSSGYPGKSLIV